MNKYGNTTFGYMGIPDSVEIAQSNEEVVVDRYATFEIKRLTKANSFTICGEVFHIGKKDPNGKATSIYHVVRVSDKRYVCPSARSKEDTIKFVQRKYIELELCNDDNSLF